MKKVLWIVGGLFIALLVAAISIPLFVNVDQYRPEISAEVNKRINGKLELGRLNLSLWGAVKINAESIRLSVNGFPGEMVSAEKFHLEIPFSSIFAGAPQVIAVLNEPKIAVVKEADGRMNALELMKKEEAVATAPAPTAPSAPGNANPPVAEPPPAASEPTKVPALLAGAKLGLKIEKGDMRYTDKLGKSEYSVVGLELDVQNLGLGSAMSFTLLAPVDGKTPSLSFRGPVSANGEIQPILVGTSVKSAKGEIDVDATKMAIEMPGKFRKPADMALTAKVRIEGNDKETLLRQFELVFHKYRVHGKGRVTMEPVTAKVDISTDPLRLDQAKDFVPMLAAYNLGGLATISANADFTPENLRVSGDLKVSEGSFFMKDLLKAPMQFQVQAGFSESALNITRASLSAPDSEVQLVGSLRNFLEPKFSLAVSGKGFNIDKTVVMAEPAKQALVDWLVPIAHAEKPAADVNPMLEMAKNPVLAKASGQLNVALTRIIVQGATLEQVQAKANLQNLQLKIQEASLRTFGGSVNATGSFDLKSPGLGFASQGNASGVSAKEAFTAYFPKFKNTLEGTVGGKWNVSGALYPATARIRNLKGSANLLATDGALKSVDIQDSINQAMAKIPFLKDKKPLAVDNGFKSMKADITFANGEIKIDPIESQPKSNGFVLKGKSTIQESLEQESFLDVYDPNGLLPRDIQQPGKPAIALRLYGPLMGPKTDYEYTVKRLASNAGKNAVKNVAEKALDKFLGGDAAQGGEKKDALKDAADKLRKKFKF